MSKKRQEKYAGGMFFSFLVRRRVLHAKRAVAKQCGLRSNTRRSPHLHHVGTDFIPFRFFFFRKNRHTCRRSSFFVRLTLWRRTRRPLGAKGSPVLFIMKKRIELKVSKKRQEKYAGGMFFSFLVRRRVLHAKRAVAKQCGLRSNTRRSPHLHHVGTDFIPFRFFFFRKNRHTCRRSSFFVRLTLWRRTRRPLGAKGSPVLFIMKKRIELKVSKNSWQNSCF